MNVRGKAGIGIWMCKVGHVFFNPTSLSSFVWTRKDLVPLQVLEYQMGFLAYSSVPQAPNP